MFSNTKTQPPQNTVRLNNEPWKSNDNHDQSPQSPQAKPFNLPINSYKSLMSMSPNAQQPTKLTLLMEPESQSALSSKTVVLVSSSQGSLHFHDEAANVFQRYPSNQVAFVGIWGSEDSDKSFFCDRILNLCDVDGDKYSGQVDLQAGSNPELVFYERPFIKDGIKFFLVDSRGYRNPTNLTKTEKAQLDILLSICQVIILFEDSSNADIVETGYEHLNDSFRRLYIDRKKKQDQPSQICWPKSLFVLYSSPESIRRHRKPESHEQELCKMFKDYNFSILHNKNAGNQEQIKTYTTITNPLDQLYLKNASIIFRQIYSKIDGKDYLNIRYTGLTCPHILAQTVYTLNQHDTLYLPRAFTKAKRSIFSSVYNRHALAYLLKMKEYIGEERPYSTDYLLDAFQQAGHQTLEEYYLTQNQISVRPAQDSLCLEYQKKLEDYIEEKEKNILAVNSKKSAKELAQLAKEANPSEQLKKVQKSIMGQNKRNFDHNAQSIFIANQIKSIYAKTASNPTQTQINVIEPAEVEIQEDQDRVYQQELAEKKAMLAKRKVELEKLSSIQEAMNQEASREVQKYKEQEKELERQIKAEEQKLVQLKEQHKSNLQSNFGSGGSNELLINEARSEINELKRMLETKLTEKKKLEEVVSTGVMDAEAQLLQTKLQAKRQEVEQVKKTMLKVAAGNAPASGMTAERRLLTAREANIRRVHNSKI